MYGATYYNMNENAYLAGYCRRVHGEQPDGLRFVEVSPGMVRVHISHPVSADCDLPVVSVKSALDFARLSGIPIELAIFRAAVFASARSGTDWIYWQGYDERFTDKGVKVSIDAGMHWHLISFERWYAIQMRMRTQIMQYEASPYRDRIKCPSMLDDMRLVVEIAQAEEEKKGFTPNEVIGLVHLGGHTWRANGKRRMYFNDLVPEQGTAKAYIDVDTRECGVNDAPESLRQILLSALEQKIALLDDPATYKAPEPVGRDGKNGYSHNRT